MEKGSCCMDGTCQASLREGRPGRGMPLGLLVAIAEFSSAPNSCHIRYIAKRTKFFASVSLYSLSNITERGGSELCHQAVSPWSMAARPSSQKDLHPGYQ
jgi:hypothetical protein